jgi:hypothetical protein
MPVLTIPYFLEKQPHKTKGLSGLHKYAGLEMSDFECPFLLFGQLLKDNLMITCGKLTEQICILACLEWHSTSTYITSGFLY